MLRHLSIIIISILAVSCTQTIDKPVPFLEHDEMVDIMTDLSLAEGSRIYALPSERRDGDKLTINDYYTLVFEKYNITQQQMDSISSWYVNYSSEYKLIFKEVLDRLNKMDAYEKAMLKKENREKEEKSKKSANK